MVELPTTNLELMMSDYEVLIHYYYTPAPMGDEGQDWVGRSAERLLKLDLLAPREDAGEDMGSWRKGKYAATERGKALCEAIRGLPLPTKVERWEMP